MRRSALPLPILLALVAGTPAVAAPSFDCTGVTAAMPKLICGDEGLAALDRELAAVLPKARAHALPGERETLAEHQQAWVAKRDRCADDDDPRACVAFAYDSRIAELQIRYGLVPAPLPVTFACSDGTLVLAAFYDTRGAPSVTLTRGSRKAIAFLRPSERGTRYEAPGAITFWTIGKETQVSWAGKQFTCTKQ